MGSIRAGMLLGLWCVMPVFAACDDGGANDDAGRDGGGDDGGAHDAGRDGGGVHDGGSHDGSGHHHAFDPYSQKLEWSKCKGGRCATAEVPIDYDDPSAGTTKLALKRVAATGDKRGTLFINPGGPGGSGIEFLDGFVMEVSPKILAAYDIVGFDPRGVGSSDPLGCLGTAGLDELIATSVDPDDEESVDAYAALVEGQGEACLKTNPELAKHVTTVETAEDLDVLRALAHEEKLDFYGASYGTFLGATYAALFPARVGRMVLDGAMDPSLTAIQESLRQVGGFQTAFDHYAARCVEDTCDLGGSVEEIEKKVADLLEQLEDEPLLSGDPDRPLTQALAFWGIAGQLYSEDDWILLDLGLEQAFDGDGTFLLSASDEYNRRGDDGYANNQQQAFTAVSCLDAQIAPPADSTPTEQDFLDASSLFGAIGYGYSEVGCDPWPIEPSVESPDYKASGAAPILVVGTTGDPATPIESAHKLADLLESGVLLIRDGEGHTAYFSGNTCIAKAIDAFFLEGALPDDGTECPNEQSSM